jgi:hypothetical protein
MKKLLIILLCFFAACSTDLKNKKNYKETYEGDKITVVEFDSCEYVIFGNFKMAHKGNCKYCAKRLDDKLKRLQMKLTQQ